MPFLTEGKVKIPIVAWSIRSFHGFLENELTSLDKILKCRELSQGQTIDFGEN